MKSEKFLQLCRSGTRAPHAWISEGYSTLDLFGGGFVLLRFGKEPDDVSQIAEAAAARACSLARSRYQ